jgi:hypothetical protein
VKHALLLHTVAARLLRVCCLSDLQRASLARAPALATNLQIPHIEKVRSPCAALRAQTAWRCTARKQRCARKSNALRCAWLRATSALLPPQPLPVRPPDGNTRLVYSFSVARCFRPLQRARCCAAPIARAAVTRRCAAASAPLSRRRVRPRVNAARGVRRTPAAAALAAVHGRTPARPQSDARRSACAGAVAHARCRTRIVAHI